MNYPRIKNLHVLAINRHPQENVDTTDYIILIYYLHIFSVGYYNSYKYSNEDIMERAMVRIH
jgi:hypothetical protein